MSDEQLLVPYDCLMNSEIKVTDLPKSVLSLDKSIRFCGIIDRFGYLIAQQKRKNLQPLITNSSRERQALQSAIRHFKKQSFEENLGKVYYHVTRYEKLIGATVQMSENHLMLLAFDPDTNNVDEIIMRKILPLIEKYRSKNKIFEA